MITVNGRQRELAGQVTVRELVAELVGDPPVTGVAVALNGEVLPRTRWEATRVGDGDRVEVLTATQGG